VEGGGIGVEVDAMSTTRCRTVEDWSEEGFELFGQHVARWEFRCGICGAVQTPEDALLLGLPRATAARECLVPHRHEGAPDIRPVELACPDGSVVQVLDFHRRGGAR
jgi:hypothetical protein